jgi:23S rRNA (guanosine2251-2'-O)-methyltransferase
MSKQIKAEKTGQQQKKTNRPQQGKYNRNTGKKTVRSGSQELNSQKQLPHGEQSARNQRIVSKGRSTSGAKSKATQKTININIDQGYEESTRNNRQYDRPGRRIILSGTERIERSNNINNQYNSAAALRFGPGSKPITKSYGRFVPQTFRKNIPMVMSEPVKKESDDHLEMIEQNLSKVNLLTGRNPIREAIKTGRDLEKLMIAKGDLSGSAREIVSLAKKAGIMIQSVERSRLDQIAKNHQGMIAFASAYRYATVEDILETAKNRGEDPFIIVLDQISDPHNLGAVIRTAACAGAHGVIVPLHRAVGLTPAAVKASAGAVEHIKVARVTNLSQTIKSLQKQGIWFYAAKMDGEDYRTVLLSGSCALVIGSEGEGVSQLIAQNCDKVISIPMRDEMNSLNASVAAGILMYAVYHQRHPL